MVQVYGRDMPTPGAVNRGEESDSRDRGLAGKDQKRGWANDRMNDNGKHIPKRLRVVTGGSPGDVNDRLNGRLNRKVHRKIVQFLQSFRTVSRPVPKK